MNFYDCIRNHNAILMEGALGERLKREYHLTFDEQVAMANLIDTVEGRSALNAIWQEYMQIARTYHLPFLATTPTRRANRERMTLGGYDTALIRWNVQFLRRLQEVSDIEMYVGGLMGCKGDAYTGADALSEQEAEIFHGWQAGLFRDAGVDFLYAGIMPTLPEAAGMARAMAQTGVPYIISFTIQKDGRLIDGTTIHDAIAYIDNLDTGVNGVWQPPVCYMTNCVHPVILREALLQPFNRSELVQSRFLGIQANTSPLSYAELDGSKDLKCSEPEAFANDMAALKDISRIKIYGGCCGTDNRHMEEVAKRLSHK